MALLLISFVAGILSVLAPCVIALLPILLARSSDGTRSRNPAFIIGGLGASVMLFSVLLKASTLLVSIPTSTWQIISGVIIILFGITYLFPSLWEKLAMALRLQEKANKTSGKALQKQGKVGDVLLGASLGPVFSACSPTYALIVASILPATPVRGFLYLLAFVAGLSSMLALIAIAGSKVTQKLGWGINPHGWFKRILGIIFLIVGILIATGTDKEILGYIVERGWFDWQVALESRFQQ
ncbi:sulfite exporter TauE/SafE family protein [Candidatus Saccharibacteria bacterium]|nr:sulfite exporter TauE/SafE family protein [Candidatus Saccharibacteria bacterium]